MDTTPEEQSPSARKFLRYPRRRHRLRDVLIPERHESVVRTHEEILASAIKMVEEPTAAAVDIRADYVAKNGNPNAAAPKIFFRYYYVNSSTGEKSGTMLAECKWTPGA